MFVTLLQPRFGTTPLLTICFGGITSANVTPSGVASTSTVPVEDVGSVRRAIIASATIAYEKISFCSTGGS